MSWLEVLNSCECLCDSLCDSCDSLYVCKFNTYTSWAPFGVIKKLSQAYGEEAAVWRHIWPMKVLRGCNKACDWSISRLCVRIDQSETRTATDHEIWFNLWNMNHLIINVLKLGLSLVESQAEIGLSLVEKSGDFGHSDMDGERECQDVVN